MTGLLKAAAERATHYLEGLGTRSVAPSPQAIARLSVFDAPLPDEPTDPEAVLALLDNVGSPATVASAGGRYFGLVIGGSLPVTVAANWLAGAWDQNACLISSSPVAAALEEVSLRWLREILGLPADCGGGLVTGTTMGNFMGLAAARHAVLEKAGWDVESQGLFGAPPVTVIVGDEVHVSLLKALGLLGFGRDRVSKVSVDRQGRMRPKGLPPISGPSIVCIQAGNVNTGAFDPAREICAMAHDAGAWVHVDGAFGLWAAAAPERRYLTTGVGDADSWTTDAHKWLNVPYDSGLVFVRRPEVLQAAAALGAAYLGQSDKREPWHYVPEASRRARGIEIWAALCCLSRSGLADLVERTCRYASRFAEGLAAGGYEILNDVVLNQVLVSFGDEQTTRRVIAGVQAEGTCWCGGSVWQGHTAMRVSVSSWATTEADIERSIAAILRVASEERRRK